MQIEIERPQNQVSPVHKNKVELTFTNIDYKVEVTNPEKIGPKTITKQILNNVSGILPAGQITAILGASGAGKTSLLNILAKRIQTGGNARVSGDCLANNKSYSAETFPNFASYVMQNDVLLETLTPREAFTFAANLTYNDPQEREKRIEETVSTLKLQDCQHTLIGGVSIKGISGGQKKRTSIGFELVTNPQVVLLDEPTSGLDSFTAFIIMQLYHTLKYYDSNILKDLCHKTNRTVAFTIHQPSTDVYNLFDRMFLLVQGKFIYQGARSEAIDYFKNMGFQCPQHSNPTDYFLSIMYDSPANQNHFQTFFDTYARMQSPIINEQIKGVEDYPISNKSVQTSFCYQMALICKRAATNMKRNKFLLKGRLGQSIFMGLLMGGIYFDIGSKEGSFQTLQSLAGCLFFMSMNLFMLSLNPVIIQFPAERDVFLREENSKLYTVSSYFVGKSTVEIPFQMIVPIIQTLICYWMIGLNDTDGLIVLHALVVAVVLSLGGNSVGLAVSTGFSDTKAALGFLPIIITPLMLFAGFFMNESDMMAWISWIKYINPIKYSFEGLIRAQTQNKEFDVDPIEHFSVNLNEWVTVLIIFGLVIFFRILAFIFLALKKTKLQ